MSQSNFLPEDYIEQVQERRSSLISLVLFTVVMVGVVGAFFVTNRQWANVKAQQYEVNEKFKQAKQSIDKYEELEKQQDQLMGKAEVAAALLEHVPRSILLAEIINRMPDSVSLDEFELKSIVPKAVKSAGTKEYKTLSGKTVTVGKDGLEKKDDGKKSGAKSKGNDSKDKAQEPPEPPKPEAPKYTVTVALVGLAPSDTDVSNFLTNLIGCSHLFKEVNLKYSQKSKLEDTNVREFRIELLLHENADVSDSEPLRAARLNRNPMNDTVEMSSFPENEVGVGIEEDKEGGK